MATRIKAASFIHRPTSLILSARALAEVDVGRGEEDLRCRSLFTVCQRRRVLSEDEETKLA